MPKKFQVTRAAPFVLDWLADFGRKVGAIAPK